MQIIMNEMRTHLNNSNKPLDSFRSMQPHARRRRPANARTNKQTDNKHQSDYTRTSYLVHIEMMHKKNWHGVLKRYINIQMTAAADCGCHYCFNLFDLYLFASPMIQCLYIYSILLDGCYHEHHFVVMFFKRLSHKFSTFNRSIFLSLFSGISVVFRCCCCCCWTMQH